MSLRSPLTTAWRRSSNRRWALSLIAGLFCLAAGARAAEVQWTDWIAGDPGTGTAIGRITTAAGDISVSYNNPQGYPFIQTGSGQDYWQNERGPDGSPYTSSVVANIPTPSELVALNRAGTQTLTFSRAITNPFLGFISLNSNRYAFNRDFEVLSFGHSSDPEGPNYSGYWGAGTVSKQVVDLGGGNLEYRLIGTGEAHGTIRFIGAFDSITWRSLNGEHWNGFTVGMERGRAPEVPSVPGDGVSIKLYNGIGGGRAPLPSDLEGQQPSGVTLSPYIDFPNPGTIIQVGQSFNTFFASTANPPDQVDGLAARNFILAHRFFLAITSDLDRNPATPAIDIQLGVGSDDGFYLTVGATLVGSTGDRA